ncbi:MAG: hypothetical protein IPN94_23280 [Sphingobacteriales bacterium]|nr:hypothetical protein [Sphingobacteriales bacterium]
MSDVSTQVAALVATLQAALPEIDSASTAGYLPAIDTQSVALIATALGHTDDGYIYSMGWMHAVHRVRLEFWVKFDVGDTATGIALVRDIGYRAMRALVAQDGAGGYTLYATEGGAAMTGAVDPTPLDPGNSGIPFLRYTLTVAVMQKEVV